MGAERAGRLPPDPEAGARSRCTHAGAGTHAEAMRLALMLRLAAGRDALDEAKLT